MNPTCLRLHSRRWTTPLLLLVILAAVLGGVQTAAAQSDPDTPFWPLFLPQVAGGAGQADIQDTSQQVLSAGVGVGICSNDKTKACSTSADCGGNTCYIPTAGGTTMAGQQCLAAASGIAGGCTANDVSLAQTTNLNIINDCSFPGDTATISFVAQFKSTATSRYDVGVWIADNGSSALTGPSCTVANFPISPNPPWLDLEGVVGTPATQDTCGDISSAGDVFSSIQSINVACVDTNGDGNLDISTCLSWDQNATNKSGTACTSPIQATAGTTSKCSCQTLPGIAIPVPGIIKVDKVTDPANDPTSFSFTLNKPGGGTTAFSLTDAQAPFNSGALPLGTYSVVESVPNGWQLTGSSCTSDQAGRTPTAGNIVLHNGETVTCTFNDKKLGTAPNLAVTKNNDANHDNTFSDVETVPANVTYPYVVTYQLVIVNNSTTAGTISSISDDKTNVAVATSTKTPTCASLVGGAIGANATLTCYYDVTFANANTPQVINTATVAATNAFGTSTKTDTSTVNFTAQTRSLAIVKTATPQTYNAVNQIISYSYLVTNNGNVTLAGSVHSERRQGDG